MKKKDKIKLALTTIFLKLTLIIYLMGMSFEKFNYNGYIFWGLYVFSEIMLLATIYYCGGDNKIPEDNK